MTPSWKKFTSSLLLIVTALFVGLAQGWVYATAILSILLAQEAVRFFVARKHQIPYALPFFIPMPHWFGTFGTFQVVEPKTTGGRALLDYGLLPPLAAALISLPMLAVGIFLSHLEPAANRGVHLVFQYPWVIRILGRVFLGAEFSSQSLVLHPLAIAGWAGLFLTLLSLFPIGHLSGARIAHALFPSMARGLHWFFLLVLLILGLVYSPIWIFYMVITVFVAFFHPTPVTPQQPIDFKRIILTITLYVIGITSFTPIPFELKII